MAKTPPDSRSRGGAGFSLRTGFSRFSCGFFEGRASAGLNAPRRLYACPTTLAPLSAACLLLLGLFALRFLFAANETQSWFLGHSFGTACSFRAHFGIPCPNCGMTRSLILAAHGEFSRSWRLAPGGAAMVLATLMTSLMLAILGAVTLSGRPSAIASARTALRVTVLTSAALVALIWLGGWGVEVLRILRPQ